MRYGSKESDYRLRNGHRLFVGRAPERGAEVLNGGLRDGKVITCANGPSIAVLRLDRLKGALSIDIYPARPGEARPNP